MIKPNSNDQIDELFRLPLIRESDKHELNWDIDQKINEMTNVEFLSRLSAAVNQRLAFFQEFKA